MNASHKSTVATPAAASANDALRHFEARLSYETDCWDTHDALSKGADDFVVLDVRGPALYAEGHVPGAINLPYGKIVGSKMNAWPEETLFVVYCAGPHCNAANKAAIRLARLDRPVKEMIGGVTGWIDEGFVLAVGEEPSSVTQVEGDTAA